MSGNNHPYEKFEEFLENLFPEANDEEDFGYFSPNPTGRNPIYGHDMDDERDTPPPIPKEAECRHSKKWIRKELATSVYYICPDCGEDMHLRDKASHDKQKK